MNTFASPQSHSTQVNDIHLPDNISFPVTPIQLSPSGFTGILTGPHWQYGVKDEGQELKPLIAWHDTTHDKASCDDFKDLVALITDM